MKQKVNSDPTTSPSSFYEPSHLPLEIQSYIADVYYQQEGLFVCKFKFTGFAHPEKRDEAVTQILFQQYLPENIRPLIHTVEFYKKDVSGDQVTKVKHNGRSMSTSVNFEEDSKSMLRVAIGDGESPLLQPGQRGVLTFRIQKKLMNFEDYPNDVQRGFNIWHMPVYFSTTKKDIHRVFSDSILVMTPEPDFSMPFNVNAVTHMLFGIMFVNTVYILIKKEEEEEKGEGEG